MDHVLYAYIAKPTIVQVGNFLRELEGRGVCISHLGKSDPPRKFAGNIDDAAIAVVSGNGETVHTFARDAERMLDFDFQLHRDARWTHSTVSASCPDAAVLDFVSEGAAIAFGLFIAVKGVSGEGKEQSWAIVHVTEDCPHDLRSRFIAG
jgi:hypothetical protein